MRSHRMGLPRDAAGRQSGSTLLEVLVAMLIAGIGVLGIAAVQGRAMTVQIDSENRRLAVQLVAQLRERVSANQQGYGQALTSASGYTQTLAAGATVTLPACANPNACDPITEVPGVVVANWFRELQRQLPTAVARIRPTTAGTAQTMTVTVGWLEPNATAVAADNLCADIPAIASNPSYRCLTLVFFPG